jgi:glucose/arabinose dehydrogenase
MRPYPFAALVLLMLAACGGGSSVQSDGSASSGAPPPANSALSLTGGFTASEIARVSGARDLAFTPSGDLLVGTSGSTVAIVPDADSAGSAGAPQTFVSLPDSPAAGIAVGPDAVYVGTQFGVYKLAYTAGDRVAKAAPQKIASFRTGAAGGHSTTSVAFAAETLYASVGSSCNACVETDPTRARVFRMGPNGENLTPIAMRIRNALALAINPATGTLWAGVAGQDSLPQGHPYEYFDPVTLHAPVADYGWPVCEENRHAYTAGADCSNTIVPAVEFPAYSTLIGAAFYPVHASGPYAFPALFRGGAFVAAHGSWHTDASGKRIVGPHVAFVALNGDTPAKPVSWTDPTAQWNEFFSGFQDASGNRIGTPVGIAVGPNGSLFIADDSAGKIYRIRPSTSSG